MKKSNKIKLNVLGLTILGCLTAGTYGMASQDIGGNIEFEVRASELTPTPTPMPELPTERHAYVYEVFGDDYDKALLVLQGTKDMNGKVICGGENYNLNQNVKPNKNIHPDGSISYDWGVFQINDKFHPVKELHLDTDYKANIDYAKRMFDNDGGTFANRWMAGICLDQWGYDI